MGPIVYNVSLSIEWFLPDPQRVPSFLGLPGIDFPKRITKVAARAAFARALLCGQDHAHEVSVSQIYRRARQAGCCIEHAAMILEPPDDVLDAFLAVKFYGTVVPYPDVETWSHK